MLYIVFKFLNNETIMLILVNIIIPEKKRVCKSYYNFNHNFLLIILLLTIRA